MSLDQVRATYDKAYEHDGLMGTDLDRVYDLETKSRLIELGRPRRGDRVLDLGTGVGRLWEYLREDVERHAIDVSHSGLCRAVRSQPDLTAAVSVAEHLPFSDAYFDLVVAADTLEHTFSPQDTLAEVARVLRPGGRFVGSVPTPDSLRKWGRNQLINGRWRTRMALNLVVTMVKRIVFFGRPDFQPIDRDMSAAQWAGAFEKSGLRVEAIEEWPRHPELPLAVLMCALVERVPR